jgi:hypothetical protein
MARKTQVPFRIPSFQYVKVEMLDDPEGIAEMERMRKRVKRKQSGRKVKNRNGTKAPANTSTKKRR